MPSLLASRRWIGRRKDVLPTAPAALDKRGSCSGLRGAGSKDTRPSPLFHPALPYGVPFRLAYQHSVSTACPALRFVSGWSEMRRELRRFPVKDGAWMPMFISRCSSTRPSYPSLNARAHRTCGPHSPGHQPRWLPTPASKNRNAVCPGGNIQGPQYRGALAPSCLTLALSFPGSAAILYGPGCGGVCAHVLQLAAAGDSLALSLFETAHPTHHSPSPRLRAIALGGASAPSLTTHTRPHHATCVCLVLSMDQPLFSFRAQHARMRSVPSARFL